MNSYTEAVEYLEEVFGTDFRFDTEEKHEDGTQIVKVVRRSDGSYLGYLASQLFQNTGDEEPGAPFLDVKVYMDMDVCRTYLTPVGKTRG